MSVGVIDFRKNIDRYFEALEKQAKSSLKDPLHIEILQDVILHADCLIDSFPRSIVERTDLKEKLARSISELIALLEIQEEVDEDKKTRLNKASEIKE